MPLDLSIGHNCLNKLDISSWQAMAGFVGYKLGSDVNRLMHPEQQTKESKRLVAKLGGLKLDPAAVRAQRLKRLQ